MTYIMNKKLNIESTLKNFNTIKPDATFTRMLGDELVSKFPAGTTSYGWIRWAAAFIIVLMVLALTGTGVVTAAYQSKPGELLYPLKIYLETQLPLLPNTEEKRRESPLPTLTDTINPVVTTPQPTTAPAPTTLPLVTPTTTVTPQSIKLNATVAPTIRITPIPTTSSQLLDTSINVKLPLLQPTPQPTQPVNGIPAPGSSTPTPTESASIIEVSTALPVIGKVKIGL